jgi:hypothetical protein
MASVARSNLTHLREQAKPNFATADVFPQAKGKNRAARMPAGAGGCAGAGGLSPLHVALLQRRAGIHPHASVDARSGRFAGSPGGGEPLAPDDKGLLSFDEASAFAAADGVFAGAGA